MKEGEEVEKLKELRKKRGLSQQFVSEKLGITQQAYRLIENGNRKLSVELAKALAAILQVEWYTLYE